MKKCSIYVACHKKIHKPLAGRSFLKYVEVGYSCRKKHFEKLNDFAGDNISNKNESYNELTLTYWVWKNDCDSDFLGICHYRRFFKNPSIESSASFSKKILRPKQIESILKEYDMICVKCGPFDTNCRLRINTDKSALRFEDIELIKKILSEKFGDNYSKAFDKILDRNWNFLLNMFVANRYIFSAYSEWLFAVLGELENRVDYNELIGQEKRIFGLWGEYLLNVFIEANNIKVYVSDVENKENELYRKRIVRKIKHLYLKIISVKKHKTILFRGACDCTALLTYVRKTNNVFIESYIDGVAIKKVWDVSNSVFLMQAALNKKIKSRFVEQNYYPSKRIFEGKYDYIVVSILSDGILGVYENKETHEKISYGLWTSDATKNEGFDYFDNSITHGGFPHLLKKDYLKFAKNYTYCGRLSVNESVDNYDIFCSSIPKKTSIIFLLGPIHQNRFGELNPAMKNEHYLYYRELNKALIARMSKYTNVFFVNPDDYYVEPKTYRDMFYYNYPTINHYPRIVYYKMAKRISQITNGQLVIKRFAFLNQSIRRMFKKRR